MHEDDIFRSGTPVLEARFPVLGIETTLRTDDEHVLSVARSVYEHWGELPDDIVQSGGPVLRIARDRGGAARSGALHPSHRVVDAERLVVQGRGVLGISDTVRQSAVAWVAPGAAGAPDFVDGVLEPLVLFLLGPRDRAPLHAAAIARDGIALLLAGESGAGKSTVAYAARAAGFATLADEPVYVQLEPRTRVWGRRARLHLSVEAREHFPELSGVAPTALPSGKAKIVSDGAASGARYADRMGLCLLRRRGSGPARLTWMSPDEAVEALTGRLDPGYDLYRDSIAARVRAVADQGAWTLQWSGGPRAAVELLGGLAAELRRP